MICPHCGIGTAPHFRRATFGGESGRHMDILNGRCSECDLLILMGQWNVHSADVTRPDPPFILYPAGPRPRPVAPEVDREFADDFREASMLLELSPKASAALSRRLLQRVIHEKAKITRRDLNAEIDAVIEAGDVSVNLAEDLDMIRTLGNFAAHPIKSTHAGQVVDVEPGEAEALLDVLEQLFDHYFVRPAQRAARRARLNEKLAGAGKPPLKGSDEPVPETSASGATGLPLSDEGASPTPPSDPPPVLS